NKETESREGGVEGTQGIVTDSEYVYIYATLDKSGGLTSITLDGEDDELEDTRMQIINAMNATIAGTQPNLSEEERENILEDLGILSIDELPYDSSRTTSNNIRYTYAYQFGR